MVIGDRDVHALDACVTELNRAGQISGYPLDVTDAESFAVFLDKARGDGGGRIDVLINNAGIDDDTPFLEVDRERWLDVVATNLTGPFLMAQAVARTMVPAGGGVILHNASIDASGGDGPFVAYNASKAGLLGLNRTMALELGPLGIRSNCVSPGFTHTLMTESAVGPALMGYLNGKFDRVPLRRLVKPTEIAAAFAVLLYLRSGSPLS